MSPPRIAVIAVLSLLSLTAHAEAKRWEADLNHTHIGFGVRHMAVSTIRGEFTKFAVAVTGDPARPTQAKVSVTIDAASITTGNAKRDAHLRSADFLDAAKYPKITFTSTKIAKAGKRGLKVTGDLTIRGKTRSVVLAVTDLVGPITDIAGQRRLGLHASTIVDRRDFGLTWNKQFPAGLLVANEVAIVIEAELVPAKP